MQGDFLQNFGQFSNHYLTIPCNLTLILICAIFIVIILFIIRGIKKWMKEIDCFDLPFYYV
jgi:hypothetical protein